VDMLEDMLPRIDFLSIHAPLTELTAGLIGLEQFELMKPTAYLINTSSGQIVDESDLYHALLDQKIAGVAIDMYSKEPACIMDFPFINLPNVIALPHIGANTYESFSRVSRIIAEHLIDALENNIYVDSVNLPFNITLSQVEEYRPYLLLAQRLGQTLGQYANQQIKEIHIHFRFPNVHEIKPIIMTVCTELLRYQYLDISLVNIQKFLDNLLLNLIVQTKYNLRYENCLNLDVQFDDGTFFSVTGTIVAGIPKIIEIQSVPIEIIPIGHGFLVECLNLPGVLGAIASLLGEYSINISNLNLSQNEIGTTAYVFILTNQETPDEVIEVIKQIDNVLDIRKINFN
jgi:D-3-phosphoglycerate dehydrogenase